MSVDDQGDGAHHHSELAVADLPVSVLVHGLDHLLDLADLYLLILRINNSKIIELLSKLYVEGSGGQT